jgi:uncharacterized protein
LRCIYMLYIFPLGFEWHEPKRQSNMEKHGIDFFDVPPLFDSLHFTRDVARGDYGEFRRMSVGVVQSRVIVVVWVMRGPCRRLISARRASEKERAWFQQAEHDARS